VAPFGSLLPARWLQPRTSRHPGYTRAALRINERSRARSRPAPSVLGTRRSDPVRCRNSNAAKSSRAPIVVVQHPTESLSPSNNTLTRVRVGRQPLDPLVAKPLVVPLLVVVLAVSTWRRCRSPRGITRARHSDFTDLTKRSAKALRFGLRAGSRTTFTPAVLSISRKHLV
jgi:hypothetical protein